MPEIQNFITITNAPTLEYLAQNYQTPGPSIDPDEIRSDAVDFSIQPIIENPAGSTEIYSADYVDTDTLAMAIGNFDTPATGGVFSLQIGAVSDSGLLNLPYNITAAALMTALNVALTAEGGTPLCTVSLVTAGVYQITAATNGTIATGLFSVTNYSALYPTSTAVFSEGTLGTASSPYVLLLVIAQAPMCYAQATVELDPADVAVTVVQAGSGTANKIQNIQFSSGAFGGSATISADAGGTTATCGTITPGMTPTQIGLLLATHPEIDFNATDGTANNIAVTLIGTGWNVEFIGTLANDDANEITSSNSSVTGPQGKSGQIAYNTFNLWLYSLAQSGDSFQLTRQIQRTRVSGEVKTIYSAPVTIKKSMINAATTVPTPLPSYYTKTQTDALFAANVSAANARFLRSDADSTLIVGNTLTLNGTLETTGLVDLTGSANVFANTIGISTGNTIRIASGVNAKAGTFTLVAGAATVANTSVTTNSDIHATLKTLGGTQGNWLKIVPTATTGFVVTSENAADASTYNFTITEVN